MGQPIRPVLTDFSAGEIDPRLAGRMDLSLSQHGAEYLSNMLANPLGGASKRGGLKFQMELGADAFLIPWSVNNDVDLIIAVFDREIKIIYAGAGVTPYFLKGSGGPDLSITYFDGDAAVPKYPTYALTDAPEIQYDQCQDEITLVHRDYLPFCIKFNGLDNANTTINLKYGAVAFTGNVAKNPEIAADNYTKITAAVFIDSCRNLGLATFPATGHFTDAGGTQRDVTSIVVAGSATARKVTSSIAGNGPYLDSAVACAKHWALGTASVSTMYRSGWGNWSWYNKVTRVCEVLPGESWTDLIDKVALYFNPGTAVLIGNPDAAYGYVGLIFTDGSTPDWMLAESLTYVPYSDGRSVTVHWSGGSEVVDSTHADITADIQLTSPQTLHLFGGIVDSSTILDYTIPWMTNNKTYPCTKTSLINGVAVLTAQRIDANGNPKLSLVLASAIAGSTATTLEISRDSTGYAGTVGVIITPFYEKDDNPSVVCYHQGRRVLGGGKEPNVLYLSKINDFSNYCVFEEISYSQTSLIPAADWADPSHPETRTEETFTQQIGKGSAMKLILATDENESLQGVTSNGDLLVRTATSEWVIPGAADATNVATVMPSRTGSSRRQAISAMGGITYLSRSDRTVWMLAKGQSIDLTKLSAHLTRYAAVTDLDFRQDPIPELYFRLDDNTALVMRSGESGPCWSRISTFAGHLIRSVVILAASTEDAVFFTVVRNGHYYLERLVTADDSLFPTATVAGRAHLDSFSCVTVAGHVVPNIAHLANQTVRIHIDGTPESRGWVTLDALGTANMFTRDTEFDTDPPNTPESIPNGNAVLGYPFVAELRTNRVDGETTEGLLKAGTKIHARVYQSGSFYLVHKNAAVAEDLIRIDAPVDGLGATQNPYTGALRFENPAGEGTDQTVTLRSTDGQALTILVLAPAYTVGMEP